MNQEKIQSKSPIRDFPPMPLGDGRYYLFGMGNECNIYSSDGRPTGICYEQSTSNKASFAAKLFTWYVLVAQRKFPEDYPTDYLHFFGIEEQ